MDLEEIRTTVRPELSDRLEDLYAEYVEGCENPTPSGFVAWLHERDMISQSTFRALHLQGGLVLTPIQALGTYFPEKDVEEEAIESKELPDLDQVGGFNRLGFSGKLAEGAMGEIHIALDNDLQRKIAVKQMTAKTARNALLAGRFYNEAQITAQLDHPNVVPVYSLESMGERGLAYTMKLIRGRTFGALIQECREAYDAGGEPGDEVDLNARIEFFLKVCDAISYAHSRGVVHRDLKPDNVMVGAFGAVYVMDWGIARLMDGHEEEIEELVIVKDRDHRVQKTQLGVAIGTPAYMSPEQADGNNSLLDGRSDQFSLGLILYELVSLRPAIRGKDTMSILMRMQRAEIDPLQPYVTALGIPDELRAIIGKATALTPDERYETVNHLADDLRHYLRGEAIVALPDRGLRRLYRWVSRHRELALVAVFFMATIAGSVAIGGLLLNVWNMQAAEVREHHLTNVLAKVSAHAHFADTGLLEYQGLLKVLSANAVEALSRENQWIGPTGDSYFRGDFNPSDLTNSEHYGRAVSIGWPVIKVAEGEDSTEIDHSIRQLTLLRQPFRRLLLQSHSEEAVGSTVAEEKVLLLEEGTPVAWAHVALENGVFFSYPGHQGFPPGYDGRARNWYRDAKKGGRGPRYGAPAIDIGGLGLMLPCAMALYDDDGFFLGVAGIEMTFDFLIGNLLEGDDSFTETFVVNADGQMVLRSSEKGKSFRETARGKQRIRAKKFPVPQVRRLLKERPSGHVVVDDKLYVWERMSSIGWFYVAEGDADALLYGKGR